ncbi:MAG: N-acetylmuramoyl-L-alanine amidase [Lachnospiraceae bacterium]|nr:N-acetylmuramoyl-L-alanine amidase [Lachnospiraceae bacterium]
MRSNVRKKKDEIALWEIVTTDRKPQTTKRPQAKGRPAQSGGRGKTLQIIGQDDNGYAVPRRQTARPQGNRQNRAVRSQDYRRDRGIQKRRQARRRRAYFYRAIACAMVLGCTVLVVMMLGMVYENVQQWKEKDNTEVSSFVSTPVYNEIDESKIETPEISIDLLEVNDYSRPGTKLTEVKNIFVHYTANPGTSAANNRSYFANLPITKERSASAHYIIGYEGEIIQCIPSDEQAFAVMTRNEDSLSIECCYLDKEEGKFTQETYDSLVHMLAWLLQEYNLKSSDILRHYDCGGKLCPLYYVEHEDAWEKLLADVDAYDEQMQVGNP